jgi:hypothetical protein
MLSSMRYFFETRDSTSGELLVDPKASARRQGWPRQPIPSRLPVVDPQSRAEQQRPAAG